MIIGVLLFSLTESKSQQLTKCVYHISFYEWSYELGWQNDQTKSPVLSDRGIDSLTPALKYCSSKEPEFIIEYPLKKNFDSVELIITDMNGNKLNVVGFELFVFRPHQDIGKYQNAGGKLNDICVMQLNSSRPNDRYIIGKISAYDVQLEKEIKVPSIPLLCMKKSK